MTFQVQKLLTSFCGVGNFKNVIEGDSPVQHFQTCCIFTPRTYKTPYLSPQIEEPPIHT